MVETAVIGEYFHIYRSFWRSHMCAVDGQPHYLVCPETCDADLPFEECTCQVDALVNGTFTVHTMKVYIYASWLDVISAIRPYF